MSRLRRRRDNAAMRARLGYAGRMKHVAWIALWLAMMAAPAHAFDLQGHRGARGLAPENMLAAFDTALKIGVTTLELDIAMTKDDVLVVSHNRRLNPDHTRGLDGKFLEADGPAIRSLTLAEVRQYDVGRLKPGTRYAADFPQQVAVDGARIPLLADVFALAAERRADHVRFNIETKITPTSGTETPDPETFAAALAKAIRDAGLLTRASIQSFDWRALAAMKRIAPEIERVCLTAEALTLDTIRRGEPGPSPWTAGLDVDDFGGSVPRLVAAAGCQAWSPLYRNARPDDIAAARSLGLKVIPWTVNERADMERLIALGVDGLITDYPDRLRAVMAAREMPLPPEAPAR
jgi:glycerophosphoryl diester phosphodiesterase